MAPSLAGTPSPGTPLPAAVAALAGDDAVELVWRNEHGGVTARIDRGGHSSDDAAATIFAKWDPADSPESLEAEAERLAWLHGTLPCPRVLSLERYRGGTLLVTAAVLRGRAPELARSVVDPLASRSPDEAAAAMGEGLRRLHALPVTSCPFPAPDWTREAPIDDAVVCHGDPCAPNTLMSAGRFAGLVDLGRLGVGDRWSDLAVASWSLAWNGLDAAEPSFWRAYGVAPDASRIARWRERWDAPSL